MEENKGKKRKCVNFTIKDKLDILQKLDAGSSVTRVAHEHCLDPATIRRWRINRQAIEKENKGGSDRKRIRKGRYEKLNEALYIWFQEMRSRGLPLSETIFRDKAFELNEKLDDAKEFYASERWLRRFKNTYGIRQLSVTGEKSSTDKSAAENYKIQFSQYISKENLLDCQIFNADETGINYKLLPNKTLADDEKSAELKENKDHVTILVCSNADGSFKLPLLMIGKSAHPRALKNLTMNSLPVRYANQKSARMNCQIFEEWFENDFVPNVIDFLTGRNLPLKAVLILDNAPFHPSEEKLTVNDIKMLSLPFNVASMIQPMDQGVIETLKKHYRLQLLQSVLNDQWTGLDETNALKSITIKEVIYWISSAWDEISADDISKCWIPLLNRSDQAKNHLSNETRSRENLNSALLSELKRLDDYEHATIEYIDRWMACDNDPPSPMPSDDEIIKRISDDSVPEEEEENEPPDDTDEVSFTRKEIFMLANPLLSGRKNDMIYDIIEWQMSKKLKRACTLPKNVIDALDRLLSELKKRWNQVSRMESTFFEKFKEWLDGPVSFQIDKEDTMTSTSSTTGGRLQTWEDSSDRAILRRKEKADLEAPAQARQTSLRAAGKLNPPKNIQQNVPEGGPSKAAQCRETRERVTEGMLSSNEALSLVIESKMTKNQYQSIRSASVKKNCKLYPPYKYVLYSKKKCYPEKMEISVTESGATVRLQALLNHTVERILMVQTDVIGSLPKNKVGNFEMICKWGCDGTSGRATCKQEFGNGDANESNDNILFISLVPLQIHDKANSRVIIWKNPRPSSPRFCRPIKIQFLRETDEATRTEVERIGAQESNLVPYQTVMNGKKININFKLALTMADGEVCNAFANPTSGMRCYLCQAMPEEFNDIDKILQKPINDEHFEFGISTLHAWIRFFECCLHLSYKLEIQKSPESKEDEELVERRKKNIQQGFRERLGLVIDQSIQGYGSKNYGNTARRFFENSEISASITGINEELIKRFHGILQVISCGMEIDIFKFRNYAEDTARKFVELYPWYFMPTTVHKILIHGHKIIDSSLLPIGQMSEEVRESCKKYIERFRRDFARRYDRIRSMENVFCRLLVTSDPLIASLRKIPPKKLKSLSSYAVELLVPPSVAKSSDFSSNDANDECKYDDDDFLHSSDSD